MFLGLFTFLVIGCTPQVEKVEEKPPIAVKKTEKAPPAAKEAPPPAADPVWVVAEDANPALLNPALANKKAPEVYRARFVTTKGEFVIEVHREWAPLGADRFYNLVEIGFFEKTHFFRAIDRFMVQWGISGYPAVSRKWRTARIKDDPVTQTNSRGMITFATSGANSRTSQVFINYKNNAMLDKMGFAPFGEVVEGMEIVDGLYKGYGDGAPKGRGPVQPKIHAKGGVYLSKEFEKLDMIKSASIEPVKKK